MADKSEKDLLIDLIDSRVDEKTAEVNKKYAAIHAAPETRVSAKDLGLNEAQVFGRALSLLVKSGGNFTKAEEVLKTYDAMPMAKAVGSALDGMKQKIQNATTPSEGGFLINTEYSGMIINPLLANTIIEKLPITKMAMGSGNLTIRTALSQGNPGWNSESSPSTSVSTVFGDIKLSAKKLDGKVVITNEQLAWDSISTDSVVTGLLQAYFQRVVDYGMLYGIGTSNSPMGLDGLLLAANKQGSASTVTTSNTPIELITYLNSLNVPEEGRAWLMHPQMWGYLINLKTTTGAFIFREEMSRGMLFGYPIVQSSSVGYTFTGTYNTSSADIFFGSWKEIVMGQVGGMEVIASREASYYNGSTYVSAFDRNETVIRAIQYCDFNIMHNTSIVKFTGKFAAT